MRKRWMVIGALVIVGFLVMMYAIPSGIKGGEPQASITLFIEDLGTEGVASAQVVVGEPSNSMSFVKPSSGFQPLTSWSGSQTVTVYKDHVYAIWASVSFQYSGDKIKSYTNAYVDFLATRNSGQALFLTQTQWDAHFNDIVDTTMAKYRVNPASVGMPGVPVVVTMSASDAWTHIITNPSKPASYGSPWTITGASLDGATLSAWVTVKGIALDDTTITATVDGVLTIHADFKEAGGTISISVDSMSAGVN